MSHRTDTEHTEQSVLREAELIDFGQAADVLVFVSSAIASGVIGNAAYDVLKAKLRLFVQRRGERRTANLAAGVFQALREKDPYAPEPILKAQVVRVFSAAGLDVALTDLPAAPPKPAPKALSPGDTWDFFLAHASPDKPVAARIHAALVARGFRPFLEAVDTKPAERWTRATPDALRNSKIIVVMTSERAMDAWFLEDEVVRAIQLVRRGTGARIVPLYLDGIPRDDARVLYGLAALQALDLRQLGSEDAAVDALAALV